MKTEPLVSVYIPVHNAAPYLRQAVESVLKQTLPDLELIIVDDGSTDGSGDIADECGRLDGRVAVHHLPRMGRAAAANEGIGLARGKYVARLDADDVSLPQRLSKQAALMESRPDIGVCSAWLRCFGARKNVMTCPTEPEVIRCALLFDSCVWNGAVMIRREVLGEGLGYRSLGQHSVAEDYDLWARMAVLTKMTSVAEVLVLYRIYPGQSASAHVAEKAACVQQVRLEQLLRLGMTPSPGDMETHRAVASLEVPSCREWVERVEEWLQRLLRAGLKSGIYDAKALGRVLYDRWLKTCLVTSGLGLWTWRRHGQSPLIRDVERSRQLEARLAAKCVLRRGAR